MEPIINTDRAIVYRTAVGLLTVPRVQTATGPHAINSAINSALTTVVQVHDEFEKMKPEMRNKSLYVLDGAQQRVHGLTAYIQALQTQGAPADVVRGAQIAQRELFGSLQNLQTHYRLQSY